MLIEKHYEPYPFVSDKNFQDLVPVNAFNSEALHKAIYNDKGGSWEHFAWHMHRVTALDGSIPLEEPALCTLKSRIKAYTDLPNMLEQDEKFGEENADTSTEYYSSDDLEVEGSCSTNANTKSNKDKVPQCGKHSIGK